MKIDIAITGLDWLQEGERFGILGEIEGHDLTREQAKEVLDTAVSAVSTKLAELSPGV